MTHITHSTYDASKIDRFVTDGLAGVPNSLAYRVHEIESHLHSEQFCYGNDGANNFEENSLDPFIITAGNSEAFGTELQIHDGTIIEGGDPTKKFDLNTAYVTLSSSNDNNYCVEIYCGTSTFGAATRNSSFYYRTGANSAEVVPIVFQSKRQICNCKIWIRCKCETDGATLSLLFECHTYLA